MDLGHDASSRRLFLSTIATGVAGFGLTACNALAPGSTLPGNRALGANHVHTNGCSIRYLRDPKHNRADWYDCNDNWLGSLQILGISGIIATLVKPNPNGGLNITAQLQLQDPHWSENSKWRVFDRWIDTSDYANNHVVIWDYHDEYQITDCLVDGTAETVTANLFSPAPPAPMNAQQSYGSLNFRKAGRGKARAVVGPDNCTSARLNFAAGCIGLIAASIGGAVLGPGDFGVIIAGGLYVAAAGVDMRNECH